MLSAHIDESGRVAGASTGPVGQTAAQTSPMIAKGQQFRVDLVDRLSDPDGDNVCSRVESHPGFGAAGMAVLALDIRGITGHSNGRQFSCE
jgi:hypothetical protein